MEYALQLRENAEFTVIISHTKNKKNAWLISWGSGLQA